MVTSTAVVCPLATVKCEPSILYPSAVTETRFLPDGRLSSCFVVDRSVSSPCAMIGTSPGVLRIDGHWQCSAKSALPPVPARGGRQLASESCGLPTSSEVISQWYFATGSP